MGGHIPTNSNVANAFLEDDQEAERKEEIQLQELRQ